MSRLEDQIEALKSAHWYAKERGDNALAHLAQCQRELKDVKDKNEQQFQMLMSTMATLKLAYARGHYCDQQPCPGCEAGRTLEAITGRAWTQEECE